MSSNKALLMVFVKNPRPGKVKTRLAESVGPERALQIYRHLLHYTRDITAPLDIPVQVWYSDHIPGQDLWDETGPGESMRVEKWVPVPQKARSSEYRRKSIPSEKKVQVGDNLGERMEHAFESAFRRRCNKAVIIGSDCAGLTTGIIRRAFEELDAHQAVVGPSRDGGYYLLGMKQHHPRLFEGKRWSTETVLADTLGDLKALNLSCFTLPELNDVDTLSDWREVESQFTGSHS